MWSPLYFLAIFLPRVTQEATSASLPWLFEIHNSALSSKESSIPCDRLAGSARKICKKNPELMEAVRVGTSLALDECQSQFLSRRWNCSIGLDGSLKTLPFDGTKEAAFLQAITSAGVSFAVTRFCSSGQLTKCGCDRTIYGPAEGFQWAGCSDNAAFGTAFAKSFLDSKEVKNIRNKRTASKSLVNLHNNEVGRKVILSNMRIECKCHGVSGSCEFKTCWRGTPTFREVGQMLKSKFETATEVKVLPESKSLVPTSLISPSSSPSSKRSTLSKRSRKSQLPMADVKKSADNDLVYMNPSPDYCERNETLGSLGTKGRICSPNSNEDDSCDRLCCGRGSILRTDTITSRCNCKFWWCCEVKCEECSIKSTRTVCL